MVFTNFKSIKTWVKKQSLLNNTDSSIVTICQHVCTMSTQSVCGSGREFSEEMRPDPHLEPIEVHLTSDINRQGVPGFDTLVVERSHVSCLVRSRSTKQSRCHRPCCMVMMHLIQSEPTPKVTAHT